jgi:alpha-amylase
VPIDDAHFKAAGYGEKDTFGYYLTEEQGALLKVFPISERMRYLVPFRQAHETIDYLRGVANESGDRCVTLMEMGEVAVGRHLQVGSMRTVGWSHLHGVSRTKPIWITFATSRSTWNSNPTPVGRVYPAGGSYSEMGSGACPPGLARNTHAHDSGPTRDAAFRAVFARGFCVISSPSTSGQSLQKKDARLGKAGKPSKLSRKTPTSAQSALLAEAERSLSRGQCNCP